MELQIMGTPVQVTLQGETGRGLLLLHGWACSASMMGAVQDAFASRMRTAAVDFPGHGALGQAPEPPESWDVHDYAKMTAEVIRRLDLAPCDIIAHSFGARVAIVLSAEHPELVNRLILTGAAGIRKPQTGKAKARTRLYKIARGTLGALERSRLLKKTLAERGREALIARFGSPDYRALTPTMRQTFNCIVTEDLSALLPAIQASTLLFWGAKDTETPLWMGRQMAKEIPDAGLIVEEGAGHFAYLERQGVFLAAASSFLGEGGAQ